MAVDFYGIDLGTCNSSICTIDEYGQPKAYTVNQEGQVPSYYLPSVVYYPEKGGTVVGSTAKNAIKRHPARCVQHIKREMGNVDYHCIIDEHDYKPEDIAAEILRKLVLQANNTRKQNGEEPIYNVVVSVPAKFGDFERRRTIKAVQQAGLNLIRLVHEPTAAALSFGIKKQDNKTFIVYDLGGGTFDVNIMRVEDNHLKFLAKGGDLHCGGIDWDAAIVRMALKTLKDESAVELLRDDKLFYTFLKSKDGQQMLLCAEEIKKNYLCNPEYDEESVMFDFKYEGKDNQAEIKLADFYDNTNALVNKTIQKTIETIKEANITDIEKEIDEIIMVGGASYMPEIEREIRNAFKIKNIHRQDPGLAIAKGAAIYADLVMKEGDWADTIGSSPLEKNNNTPIPPETIERSNIPPREVKNDLESSTIKIASKSNKKVTVRSIIPDIKIDETGGKSYGIVYTTNNGRYKWIETLINKNDKLVFQTVYDDFVINQSMRRGATINIDIREYDSFEKIIRLKPDDKSIYCPVTTKGQIPLPHDIQAGTTIFLEISRNKDGLIKILANCDNTIMEIQIEKETH